MSGGLRERAMLACAFDAMLVLDQKGRIRDANLPASRLFGRSMDWVIGKRVGDLGGVLPRGRSTGAETVLTIERSHQPPLNVIVREFPGERPRTRVWILREAAADGAISRKLESNSRLLAETERVGGVGGWEMDVKTRLLAWTPEMSRIMGMPSNTDRISVEESYDFYTEPSRSIVREAFEATVNRGTPYDLVLEGITEQGNRIWIREVCRAVVRKGQLVSVIGFSQDITEQRRLAGLVNDIGNQERARIGADLHDGLGQELTGLALMLRGVAKRAEHQNSGLSAELRGLSKLASKSIESVRDIAHGLLPLRLSQVGFRQELKRLARSTRTSLGVRVRIRIYGEHAHMPVGETAENLYRIAQEAIAAIAARRNAPALRDAGKQFILVTRQRGGRSMRQLTLLLIASIAGLCACGGLDLNPLTNERRSVHFETDASKSLTVVRDMTWTDKSRASHQLRFPAGVYSLEAEDADYFYMRSGAPLELTDFHKGGGKDSHTLRGGIAIGKYTFRAVPASGYIDGAESSRVLVWKLGKDFLGREGTDWRKSF